jgi:hypothetical protein
VDMIAFGEAQYHWNPEPNGGAANPDGPAAKSQVTAGPSTTYSLPKASVTVLRGELAGTKARVVHETGSGIF